MKRPNFFSSQLTVLRSLHFFNYATQTLIATFFPLYFYDLGFTKLQIGAVYSVGPMMSIFANLLAGIVSDKTQGLRRVLNLIFLGQIVALALLLPQKEFVHISLLMALMYLFQTPVNAMMDSMTLLAASTMKRSFASIRMFGSLGFALCSLVFGYVLKQTSSDLTLWLALGTVCGSLLISLGLADFQSKVGKFRFGGLLDILKRGDTLVFFLLVAFVSIAHRMNEGFLGVAMRDLGASDDLIGYAWLASAASEIPVFFLLARYGDRFKEIPLLAIASLLYAVRLSLISVIHEPAGFIAVQAMHSVTFGIYYITALRYLQSVVSDAYRSSGQALFSVVWTGIAGLIAGTVGGALFDAYGLSVVFRTGAASALIAAAGFMLVHLRKSRV